MTTKYIRAAGGASNVASTYELTIGGGETTTVPTNADTVIGHSTSGNFSVAATLTCQGLDLNTYTATISGSSAINIGGAAAAAGNVALRIGASITWTATGAVSFAATTGTVQTITSNGKTIPAAVNFSGAGGSWKFVDAAVITGTISHTAGTVDLNNLSHTISGWQITGSTTKSIIGGTSTLNITGTGNTFTYNGTGLSASLSSMTLNFTSTTFSQKNIGFPSSISALGTVTESGNGSIYLNGTGGISIGTLTVANIAVKSYLLAFQSAATIGTMTISGSSATNRPLVASSVIGTPISLTVNGWGTTPANVDFRDITAAGSANWNLSSITGGSGDCGGNTGITFTTATTQSWVGGTTSGNWSDASRWTSRVPLPQDNAVINVAFNSGIVITFDMPRVGKNIDFTGATWTGTALSVNKSLAFTVFGDFLLADGMAHTGSVTITAEWREPHRIYMANTAVPSGIVYTMPTKQITNAGAMMAQIGFNGGLAG